MVNLKAETNNWAMLCLSPAKGGLEMLAVDTVNNISQFKYLIVLEDSWIANNVAGRDIYLLPKLNFRFFPYSSALKIAKWIEAQHISLLHVHWAKDIPLAALVKKILVKKRYALELVVSRHMSLPHPKKSLYHRWVYSAVDAYVSVCDFVHQQALHNLPLAPNKLYKVYPGVNAVQQEASTPFVIDKNKFNFIVLGRLEPAKGQHLMLEALAVLANYNVHCYFVGHAMDEKYLSELEALAGRLGITAKVTFCGFVSEPSKYLRHFDALILTTYCETLGLVLIEAMRAGIVAVGSNCGGVVEIIEHKKTGLLFTTKNVADLAHQLEWAITNPKEAHLITLAGKDKADKLFDKKTNYMLLAKVLYQVNSQ